MDGLNAAVRVQLAQGRNAGASQVAAEEEQGQAVSREQVQDESRQVRHRNGLHSLWPLHRL